MDLSNAHALAASPKQSTAAAVRPGAKRSFGLGGSRRVFAIQLFGCLLQR